MNNYRLHQFWFRFMGKARLLTKLFLLVGTTVIATTHIFEIEVFEHLVDFLETHEKWELDEIFLFMLLWVPTLLLDYYLDAWRHLRQTNKCLKQTNAQLIKTNRVKAQILVECRKTEAQLHQTNQELTRVTRLKDEFLASMSHEFRTPLNAILGITEGLQGGIYGSVNSDQIGALQTLERSGFHLLDLINDILDVARIESGQLQLNRTPTPIQALCKSCVGFIEQLALKKHLHLALNLAPHLPKVDIDERRMRQVLLNLLNNAVKFTPEDGRITLEVNYQAPALAESNFSPTLTPGRLQITVTDTGIGIAPHHLNQLFQPFVQIDSALNRQHTGTGLGLTLVQRIVELHGGQVSVTSQVGAGSCFTVELPCTPSTALQDRPNRLHRMCLDANLSLPPMQPLILLAEDNEATVKTVSRYLSAKGYRVVVATSGEEAVALAQSKHPDLILMDIQMPGIDGLEATQRLRGDPDLAEVPIIAVTALAMAGDRERCLAAGVNAYFSKPIKFQKLVATIQHLTRVNRQTRPNNRPFEA